MHLRDLSYSTSVSARLPRMSDSAPIRMDFPAPVSPVMTVKPLSNAMSSERISA